MPIEVRCGCGKQLQAPDDAAGREAKCPHCGRMNKVGEPLPPWDPRERAAREQAKLEEEQANPSAPVPADPSPGTPQPGNPKPHPLVIAAIVLAVLANVLAILALARAHGH